MARVEVIEATIPNGQSLSDPVDLGWGVLTAIQMPSSWTSAGLSFRASYDGVTFGPIRDLPGNFPSTGGSVAANEYISVHTLAEYWKGIRWLQVVSANSGTPVNQGADRTLYLIVT